jgi:hypothetical protein
MQISSRPRLFSLAGALLLCLATAAAQTLARPGWAGSGLVPETWWRHAVFYRLDSAPLPTLVQLPSLQAFGIDAILLTPESMQPPAEAPADAAPSLDDLLFECSRLHIRILVPLDIAAPGATPANTLALARSWLYRGAAGFVVSGIDKLIQVPATTPTPDPATPHPIRLHRGAAAIHLAPAVSEPQILLDLRKLLTQFPGERILVGAANTPPMPSLQIQIATIAPAADTIRLADLSTQTSPHPLLSLAGQQSELTPIDATLLLATNQPAILDSTLLPADLLAHVFAPLAKAAAPDSPAAPAPPPPPLPPENVYGTFTPYVSKDMNNAAERKRKAAAEKAQQEEADIAADIFPVQPIYQPIAATPAGLIAFYHRLIQLHRANATLHDGTLHVLDTASQPALAWAATRAGSASLVIVCNPSDSDVKLDLSAGLRKIVGSQNSVRTLLHTAAASGVVDVDRIAVPPHGVYIGELGRGYTYR